MISYVKLPELWHTKEGFYRPKDFIREITIGQPGRAHIERESACITVHQLEDALTAYGG